MNIVFLGIHLDKNVFQLCRLNQAGKPVFSERVSRKELLWTVANIPACLIGVEASTGEFYWQREFEKLGHNEGYQPPVCKTLCPWAKKRR